MKPACKILSSLTEGFSVLRNPEYRRIPRYDAASHLRTDVDGDRGTTGNDSAKGETDMTKRVIAWVIGALMLTCTLAACGTVTGAAVGAGAGAAVGAGTGYGAGKGALIGTGVGAVSGAIYDTYKK